MRYKHEELIGRLYGKWTLISFEQNKRKCRCRCTCGKEKLVWFTHLIRNKTKGCNACANIGAKSKCWKGVGEISADWWRSHVTRGGTKLRMSNRNKVIEIHITMEEAWQLFLKQNRRCALSGVEISFPKTNASNGTASLDRIDSAKGYELGNVQWVHKTVNLMKNKLAQDEFIEFCACITEQRRSNRKNHERTNT